MKKTFKEILEILEEKLAKVEDFAYESYDEEKLGLGPIEEVHQEGGEGEGSHWESVQYFKEHDVYISVVGYYTSYHGTDFYDGWSCCKEVKPKEKTITVYE